MNRLELLTRIANELRNIREVKEVEEMEGYYPWVDAYLKIVVDPLNVDVAEKISDRIAEIQFDYLEKTGKMPVIEWDVVEGKVLKSQRCVEA